jgi:F-type H+-transporting ATPase subunit gamma
MNLHELRERKRAVEAVHGVVSAMRSTAAGRIQAAQRAMSAARKYREVVLRALHAADPKGEFPLPISHGVGLLIVLTSEQPLCGGFNHSVIDRAIVAHRDLSREFKIELVAVGQRGSRVMAARGLTPNRTESGSTSLSGLRNLVRSLATRVDHGYVSGAFASIHVVYARYRSVSEQIPTLDRILPFDPPAIAQDPSSSMFARYLPPPHLISGLIGQYAFINLYHALAESYASEQASRLVAMDGATTNTDRMIDELLNQERRERQSDVTRQMLELTASRFGGETNLLQEWR